MLESSSVEQGPLPSGSQPRIQSLDVLRGFALLGILVMNIQSFSMIEAAYLNPTAYGDLSGINLFVWAASHLFADQKFMTIFSLLFGAGIALMAERVEASGRRSAGPHYRRMIWLLVFGLLHAYGLWYGDILVSYSVCGMVVFLLRKWRPGLLAVLGLLALCVPSLIFYLTGLSTAFWPPETIEQVQADWMPEAWRVSWEIEVYRGSWLEQMEHRVPTAMKLQTLVALVWFGWRVGGLMLLGVALLRWGVITGDRSRRFYLVMLLAGVGLGLPVIAAGMQRNFASGWSVEYSMFNGAQFNYWGSLLVSTGYIGAVMLVQQSARLALARQAMASVGRMALTNYLAQTLICTTLFYGHGLGLFGSVERWQQALIVLGICCVQVCWSVLWLRHFRQGPFEWLWRWLTYLQAAPMRARGLSPAQSRMSGVE
jgi:uncharacterized protein